MSNKIVSQRNLMVGNIIDVMGTVQLVMGLVFRPETNDWFIQHSSNKRENIPIPDGVEFNGMAILATKEWKVWLGVEKRKFPKHIKYVHQIQQHCLINYGIDITDNVVWETIPNINMH